MWISRRSLKQYGCYRFLRIHLGIRGSFIISKSPSSGSLRTRRCRLQPYGLSSFLRIHLDISGSTTRSKSPLCGSRWTTRCRHKHYGPFRYVRNLLAVFGPSNISKSPSFRSKCISRPVLCSRTVKTHGNLEAERTHLSGGVSRVKLQVVCCRSTGTRHEPTAWQRIHPPLVQAVSLPRRHKAPEKTPNV